MVLVPSIVTSVPRRTLALPLLEQPFSGCDFPLSPVDPVSPVVLRKGPSVAPLARQDFVRPRLRRADGHRQAKALRSSARRRYSPMRRLLSKKPSQLLAPIAFRRAQIDRSGQLTIAADQVSVGGVVEGDATAAIRPLRVEGVERQRGGGDLGHIPGEGNDARIEWRQVRLERLRSVPLAVDGNEQDLEPVSIRSKAGQHIRPIEQRGWTDVGAMCEPE